jgi:GTP1/Obg family GTP-binding protein
VSAVRHMVDNIGRDYVRLLKYGDSLYRCKQLKRAALGRMATACKKLSHALSYLEKVRQHMSRLPSIDPNTRTLLITGFPNVGQSSLMNEVTRAEVEVQPFTSLFRSIKPLFSGKLLVVVFNKCDVCTLDDLAAEQREAIMKEIKEAGAAHITTSTLTDQGIGDLKRMACEMLLAQRIDLKEDSNRYQALENRLYCAVPEDDGFERPTFTN